ncbi:MAG: homocysteine S-methyltransferase family protein [Nocardioidaceae bacterium]
MTPSNSERGPGLLERLDAGPVLCAEGYLFELERRGYLQAGAFVPEVVLEHPEQVTALHRDFVRAGSDVVEALTYYAHREKLRAVGKDGLLEDMNRQALEIWRGRSPTTRARCWPGTSATPTSTTRRIRRRTRVPGRCSRSRSVGRRRRASTS